MGKKLRLGIVGHGFVGKAMDGGFSKETEKYIVDPLYNNTIDDLANFNPELIFVCVPTPMSSDGSINSSIIEEVVIELSQKCDESIVVVKSTVIPSVLKSKVKLSSLVRNPPLSLYLLYTVPSTMSRILEEQFVLFLNC